MALGSLAQDLPAGNLQCGIERESAMPEILKAVTLRAAGRQRQDRVEAVERLNGGFFIDAEHGGMRRRLEVKPDDVADLTIRACHPSEIESHIVFSALDSDKAEDLWAWMDGQRKLGNEVLASGHG